MHIGLLVIGAALAGGVAVKMTQQPPTSIATTTPVPAPPVATPDLVVPSPKPSPVAESGAAAPPVVYTEAPTWVPAPRKLIRKNEPNRVEMARVTLPPAPPPYVAPPVQPQLQPQPPAPVEPEPAPAAEPAPVPAPAVARRSVTLHTGTLLSIRTDESLSSERNVPGDTFSASLAEPLIVNGLVIAERGSRVTGRVVSSQKAGRLSGTSLIELELSSFTTSDGQKIAVSTEPWARKGDSSQGRDAATIGGGAAIGAIIGAIAGGGKGAAIGAGIGGGAGAGTVAATRGKPVSVPSETVIRFRLASTVTITERL